MPRFLYVLLFLFSSWSLLAQDNQEFSEGKGDREGVNVIGLWVPG
jgi:hypothetical protein